MIQTSLFKTKPECTIVQNDIVGLAEHVEKLLSELSNDNEYSASKSEVFFFTSNDELQKKMGQTPFNPRLKEEIQRLQQNVNYKGVKMPVGEYTQLSGSDIRHHYDGLNSFTGVMSGDGLPITSAS